jgi:alpha-galactosidase
MKAFAMTPPVTRRPDAGGVAARIDAADVTLVVAGPAGRIPAIVYFGPALPPDEDLAALAAVLAFPVAHASFDAPYVPSLVPEAGRGHPGMPALEAYSLGHDRTARRWSTRFALTGLSVEGARLSIAAEDDAAALALGIDLSLESGTGVLRATTRLANRGSASLVVNRLAAPAVPVPRDDETLVTWHGRWTAEFHEAREPWPRGARVIGSRAGRTSHEAFPGLLSLGPGTGETAGRALGVHLAWNGSWWMAAEDHAPGHRHVLAGVDYLPGETILAPGAELTSPTVFAAVSDAGLSALSGRFHREVRETILVMPRPDEPRPVHFNSWEAVYFDLSVPVLKDLADAAAAVGAERFVVDDGWFPGRANDRAGLGDWWVDRTKFPDGLHPVIDHVRALGLGFGLWVEPEMVNPDSDLYRAHPDWALRVEPHEPATARHQLVLDVARPEVADYLFGKLDALLSEYRIDYLKWDMNRVLAEPGRAGVPVAAAQADAVRALMALVRAAHPETEIESCSSGGGRIDYAILENTQRVWLSDNNDAHDRWRMNRAASVFFPPEVFGHHVGPAPCHTSGRRFSMAFRAFTAAVGGHMGLELDLRRLPPEELDVLKAAIAFHKRWRDLLHAGVLHRLETEPTHMGQVTVAPDGMRFLASIVQRSTLPSATPPVIRLAGLDPDARYRVRFADGAPVPRSGDRGFATPLDAPEGWTASGRALMASGFRLPTGWPDEIWLVAGERV